MVEKGKKPEDETDAELTATPSRIEFENAERIAVLAAELLLNEPPDIILSTVNEPPVILRILT